jgi:uncharacterized OB-fold protein
MYADRSVPTVTPTLEPFFDAARRGVLALQTCTSCGGHWFPPSATCPSCLGDSVEWVDTSGRATLWSWVVMHQPYFKAFKDLTPYHVVFVKLEEGPILVSALLDIDVADFEFDMPLEVDFVAMGAEDLPMPAFRVRADR